MSRESRKTIEAYENGGAEGFATFRCSMLQKNPKLAKKRDELLKQSLETVGKNAKLFEIGSGTGDDAKYIRSLGYDITVSDVAKYHIDTLKRKGFEPLKFDAVEDEFPEKYDYILARAVLVHFPHAEVEQVVRKIYSALNDDGIFNVSVKEKSGHKEEWLRDFGVDRYISYWTQDEIRAVLESAGFTIALADTEGGLRSRMLHFVARKEKKW